MKTGVIIVFKSRIKDIPKDQLVALFNNAPKIEFCLLHKLNDEVINDYLIGIAEQCENVSFVSIRNNKMNVSSVRAGSRFMHNEFNLNFLGYVIESKRIDLIHVLETFVENSDEIALRHNKNTRNKKNKQTFIQRLLSLPEFQSEPNEMANDPALIS